LFRIKLKGEDLGLGARGFRRSTHGKPTNSTCQTIFKKSRKKRKIGKRQRKREVDILTVANHMVQNLEENTDRKSE